MWAGIRNNECGLKANDIHYFKPIVILCRQARIEVTEIIIIMKLILVDNNNE